MAHSLVSRVSSFWFKGLGESPGAVKELMGLWFGGGSEIDSKIRELFGEDVEAAGKGAYSELESSADGTLSLIILLDQFTRNVFRGTPDMFKYDGEARRLAHHAVDRGFDQTVGIAKRLFFYLPFEHAEDRDLQAKCVDLFKKMHDEASEDEKQLAASFLEFAIRHQTPVDKFGRFPHRNAILGRETTPEEQAFLEEHSGFV